MPVKRTIIAAGEGARYEYKADAVITPGDLVNQTATGVARHAAAGVKTGALFAIENEIFGRGINTGFGYSSISEPNYAVDDRVLCEACTSGMMVNVNIAAAALAIAVGDFLESAGNGTLRKVASSLTAIAQADEAVDNSAGGSMTRIRARIL